MSDFPYDGSGGQFYPHELEEARAGAVHTAIAKVQALEKRMEMFFEDNLKLANSVKLLEANNKRLLQQCKNAEAHNVALRAELVLETTRHGNSDRWDGDYTWCGLCMGEGRDSESIKHLETCVFFKES